MHHTIFIVMKEEADDITHASNPMETKHAGKQ
jgi:hypothetical protein